MLSFFRRLVASKVGKLIFFLVLATIALGFLLRDLNGGAGGGFGGGGQDATIAKVGGAKIGAVEVGRAVDREIANARQQVPTLDGAAFASAGGVERTLEGVIGARALEVFAANQGLAASKRMIDGEIASIPAFAGPAGKFDQQAFLAVLRQQNLTEAQVRADLAGEVLRRQLLVPIAGGAGPPRGVAANYAALLLEVRKGMIGVVPAKAMPLGKPPGDAAVSAYYSRNIARYTLGERRVLRYALFGPETATVPTPGDADIQRYYDANSATYGGKVTRTLSQVVFPDQAAATAFSAKLRAGTAFDDAAKAAGYQPTDTALGVQSEAQFAALANAAAAKTVFALPQGAVSVPIKSDLGWHVVKVDAITSTTAKPLASVRAEIVAKLSKELRDKAVADEAAAIDDAISDGKSFDDVARQFKLTVVTTPPVLSSGIAPEAPGFKPAPQLAGMLKTAFEATAGEDPTVESIGQAGEHALLGVSRIDASRPVPLAEIKPQVIGAIQVEGAQRAAKAIADAIVAKANRGGTLQAAISAAGLPLPPAVPAGGRRLDITRQGPKVPPPLMAMFAMPVGKAIALPAPGGQGWFVVKLDSIARGDVRAAGQLVQATQQQFAPLMANEYAEQFARATQTVVGVKRDAAALQALKAKVAGAAPAAQ